MHSINPQAARGSLSVEEFDKAETSVSSSRSRGAMRPYIELCWLCSAVIYK